MNGSDWKSDERLKPVPDVRIIYRPLIQSLVNLLRLNMDLEQELMEEAPDTLRTVDRSDEDIEPSEPPPATIQAMDDWFSRAKSVLDEAKIPVAFKVASYIPDVLLNGRAGDLEASQVFEEFRFELLSKMMTSNFGNLTLADFLSQYHDNEKVQNLIFDGMRKAGPELGWSNSEIENSILFLKESMGKDSKPEDVNGALIASYMLRDDYVRKSKEMIAQLKRHSQFRPVMHTPSEPKVYDPTDLEQKKELTTEKVVYGRIENMEIQFGP